MLKHQDSTATDCSRLAMFSTAQIEAGQYTSADMARAMSVAVFLFPP